MSTIDTDRFGTDLYLDLDPEAPIRVTPTGDLPTVTGYACLRQDVAANAITTPGSMVHRPDYGGGLLDAVETPGTPGELARAGNRIRRSLRRDARIVDAKPTVTPGTPSDPGRLGTVTVDLVVQPIGDPRTVTVTVTSE